MDVCGVLVKHYIIEKKGAERKCEKGDGWMYKKRSKVVKVRK